MAGFCRVKNPGRGPLTAEEREKVLDLDGKGYGLRAIALRVDRGRNAVLKVLEEAGRREKYENTMSIRLREKRAR